MCGVNNFSPFFIVYGLPKVMRLQILHSCDKLLVRLVCYNLLTKMVLACIDFNVIFLVGLAEKCCPEMAIINLILLPQDVRSLQFSLCPNPTSACSLECTKENIREAWFET